MTLVEMSPVHRKMRIPYKVEGVCVHVLKSRQCPRKPNDHCLYRNVQIRTWGSMGIPMHMRPIYTHFQKYGKRTRSGNLRNASSRTNTTPATKNILTSLGQVISHHRFDTGFDRMKPCHTTTVSEALPPDCSALYGFSHNGSPPAP